MFPTSPPVEEKGEYVAEEPPKFEYVGEESGTETSGEITFGSNDLESEPGESPRFSTFASVHINIETVHNDLQNFKSWATGWISDLNSRVAGLQNWINFHNDWAGNLGNRVNSLEGWRSTHDTWAGNQANRISTNATNITTLFNAVNGHVNVLNNHASNITSLFNWKNTHDAWAGKQSERIDWLNSWVTKHEDWAGKLGNRVNSLEGWRSTHDAWAGKQSERIDSLNTWKDKHEEWAGKQGDRINSLESWKTSHETWAGKLGDRVNSLESFKTTQTAWNATQTLWNTNQSNRISKLENRHKQINNANFNDLLEYGEYYIATPISNYPVAGNGYLEVIGIDNNLILQRYTEWATGRTFERQYWSTGGFRAWKETTANKSDIDALKAKDIELTNLIKNETDDRKAADTLINNKLVTINQAIDNLNVKIDSLNWSDLGIIAVIRESMKSNNDLWSADHYDGASVGENDGKAVRLFKNQFQGLKTHLAGVLAYYFDMNDKDSAIYKLRYSIVAGFEETRILLADKLPKIIEAQGTTNTYLSAISTWLELQDKHFKTLHSDLVVVTQWLSEIFKKPVPSITVPPIVIPPIEISEEKNGWLRTLIETVGDVMKTAIETLGSVLETAIKELGKSLKDILMFLDGLLDDIIHLLVPENMDFFNDSVAGIKETSDTKIKPITDLTGKFVDALNVNDRSRRLRGNGAIFGTSLVDSLKFTIMGTEVDMTPDNSVLQGVAIVRRVISVFVIGYTGFAIKRRVRGKEGLIE